MVYNVPVLNSCYGVNSQHVGAKMDHKIEEYRYIQNAILNHQRLIFQIFTFSVIASVAVLGWGLQSLNRGIETPAFTPFLLLIPMAIILPSAFIINGMRQDILRWGAYIMLEHEGASPGYETLLDRIRDGQGRFAESYTPLIWTYWALSGVCNGVFIWSISNIYPIHMGFSALVALCFVLLAVWSRIFTRIPSKSNRDKLKKDWWEAKRVSHPLADSGVTEEESGLATSELTIKDIKSHLEKQDKEMQKSNYLTAAAFGAAVALVGVSLLWGSYATTNADKWFLVIVGVGFMVTCLVRVKRIRS